MSSTSETSDSSSCSESSSLDPSCFGVSVWSRDSGNLLSLLREFDVLDGRFRSSSFVDEAGKSRVAFACRSVDGSFACIDRVGCAIPGARLERFSSMSFVAKRVRVNTLRGALSGVLSDEELGLLPSSFDTIGTIIVIGLPDSLLSRARLIGEALLHLNKRRVKTVCRITGSHHGDDRIQPLAVIAGDGSFIARYRESGCVFRLDVSRVFFSPRLACERMRIASLVGAGESVGCFFAGVGPFPLVIAKNGDHVGSIVAIELNSIAVEFMRENVCANRMDHLIRCVHADVRDQVKHHVDEFDRIVMPIPHVGGGVEDEFLPLCLPCVKDGGWCHYFAIVVEDEDGDGRGELLRKICEDARGVGRRVEVDQVELRKVRSFGPRVVQVTADFRVWMEE